MWVRFCVRSSRPILDPLQSPIPTPSSLCIFLSLSLTLALSRTQNNSLPFNKYAFLTTHDSYPSHGFTYLGGKGGQFSVGEKENSVTTQLNVRLIMTGS